MMIFKSDWPLRELPRERLEEIALRAAIELRMARLHEKPNLFFYAVLGGFALGAMIATAGFLVGAAIR